MSAPSENSPASRQRELFLQALEKSEAERGAFLDAACGGDTDLRRNLEELLQESASAGTFMEHPALHDPNQLHRTPKGTVSITASMVSATEKPGDRIGPYKILQQIGEGGCGVV